MGVVGVVLEGRGLLTLTLTLTLTLLRRIRRHRYGAPAGRAMITRRRRRPSGFARPAPHWQGMRCLRLHAPCRGCLTAWTVHVTHPRVRAVVATTLSSTRFGRRSRRSWIGRSTQSRKVRSSRSGCRRASPSQPLYSESWSRGCGMARCGLIWPTDDSDGYTASWFRISRLSVPGPGVQTADDALVDITVSRRVRLVLV